MCRDTKWKRVKITLWHYKYDVEEIEYDNNGIYNLSRG